MLNKICMLFIMLLQLLDVVLIAGFQWEPQPLTFALKCVVVAVLALNIIVLS